MAYKIELPKSVREKINGVGVNDFSVARMSVNPMWTNSFLEDVPLVAFTTKAYLDMTLDDFKAKLAENVGYFANELQMYLQQDARMIVFDGTSAISYWQIFHSAFREYGRLHPSTRVPEMVFIDAHPLRNLRATRYPQDNQGLLQYVHQMGDDDIHATWHGQSPRVLQTLDRIRRLPSESTVIIFDERSNPLHATSSLGLVTEFLSSQAPQIIFQPRSPLIEDLGKRLVIADDHPARLLKRPDDYFFGDPTVLIRPTSNRRNDETGLNGRSAALQLSAECRQIGRLIAAAMR